MEKIESELLEHIKQEPKKEFNVLIVTDSDSDIEQLNLRNYKRLMSNIATAKLTGEEISKASVHPSIQSIEEDKEMGIL